MAHRGNDRPTYPEILNFYYRGSFPSILGGPANSVAHAIMFKSNSLFFPDSFRMANAELCQLSGIEFNIGRLRQKVIKEVVVNETPLFAYSSRGQTKAGVYRVNFTLISIKSQLNLNKVSNRPSIDNDHNLPTKLNFKDQDARANVVSGTTNDKNSDRVPRKDLQRVQFHFAPEHKTHITAYEKFRWKLQDIDERFYYPTADVDAMLHELMVGDFDKVKSSAEAVLAIPDIRKGDMVYELYRLVTGEEWEDNASN